MSERYWHLEALRLRAEIAQLRGQLVMERAKWDAARALTAFHEAMRAAGFDPRLDHQFDDAAETIGAIGQEPMDPMTEAGGGRTARGRSCAPTR